MSKNRLISILLCAGLAPASQVVQADARVVNGCRITEAAMCSEARLACADLRGVHNADLSRVNLSRARAAGADFRGASLNGALLHNAVLIRANLQAAGLRMRICKEPTSAAPTSKGGPT